MPSSSVEEVKEILIEDNEEFARIYRKHRELDEKVTELEELHYLTPEEEIQEKKMKKDKLRLKDQMAETIKEYQASH
ncbi:MAG: YdcH family protein [bacterium]|nr:YdcH family protein [bacterium]